MEYNTGKSGSWVDADKIPDGTKAKFMDECVLQESKFKDKDGNTKNENVVKVRYENMPNALNARINWASIYGLVAAFGKDSKEWVGKYLTVRSKEMMVGDTLRTVLYYVADGFELVKNEEKKLVIQKIGGKVEEAPVPKDDSYPQEDISPEDIPF